MSTISSSTTNTTALNFTADTTGNLVVQTGSTPTTAVTIDGSQNVNVGSATQIGAEKLGISFDDSTLNGLGLQVQGSSSSAGYVAFRNSSGSLIGSISRNGTASSLKFNTTSSGTTGSYLLDSGIAFPATQVASSDANTLDDYEEGTFTPVLNFSTGTTGLTGTITGKYTKIGNVVYMSILINLTNKGSSSGYAYIDGLPFTSDSAKRYYFYGGYYAMTTQNFRIGKVGGSSTRIELLYGDEVQGLTNSNFNNTTELYLNGWVHV